MRCKFTYVDGIDSKTNEPVLKEITFNRTFGVEENFKKDLNSEYNAQIGILASKMVALDENPSDPKAISEYTDLNFADTRHQILRYSYAERNENGVLVQNEETRATYDKLVDDDKVDEKAAFAQFFQSI